MNPTQSRSGEPRESAGGIFASLCAENGIPFEDVHSVRSYDETTLFCSAGMQQFKARFIDSDVIGETVANIQTCLRLTDLTEAGDGTHAIVFRMIGLFSFRHWSVRQSVAFFHELLRRCGIAVAYVTIHPDKWKEWQEIHPPEIECREDPECQWSDGTIEGYCTEFYVLDEKGVAVEVGNVVNPLGTCIDVGFGLERIDRIMTNSPARSRIEELRVACEALLSCGFLPTASQQGYVLRKLLRMLDKEGGTLAHPIFESERAKRLRGIKRYQSLLPKHRDKTSAWWWDTHGIDVNECDSLGGAGAETKGCGYAI